MRELRAVFVMVPALVAELILRAAAARGVALVAGAPEPADVVILGPRAGPCATAVPVLALSADLSRLLGPGAGDDVALTGDALAARLRDIARAI